MTIMLGAKIGEESAVPLHTLGTRYHSDDGKEYVYLLADEAITGLGSVVLIDGDYGSLMADATSANGLIGKGAAASTGAVTNAYYYWAQTFGVAEVLVAASAAAGSLLHVTATGGVLDDAAANECFNGIHATEADGGSGGLITCVLSYPTIRLSTS